MSVYFITRFLVVAADSENSYEYADISVGPEVGRAVIMTVGRVVGVLVELGLGVGFDVTTLEGVKVAPAFVGNNVVGLADGFADG